MTSGSKRRAWLSASLHPATLAGVLLIVACWVGAVFVFSVEHDIAVEAMVRQSEGLARLFEQNVEDTLERCDRTLLLLRKSYEDDPKHFDLRAWAAHAELVTDMTWQLTLVGPDGFVVASTADYSGSPNIGDRAQFNAQIDPVADKLFISEPTSGPLSSRLSIKLSRRIRLPNGGFGGVIVLSLDPGFIQRFYRTADLGKRGSLILRNRDGALLAAQGLSETALDQMTRSQALPVAPAHSGSGNYWQGGRVDGENRLETYRVSDKYPLMVSVGMAESDALRGYRANRKTGFVATAIVSFSLLMATLFNIRRQVKLEESQARLKLLNDEVSMQNRLFDAALHHMSNGLCMFDADGKLMVWNEQYIELYGMSRDLIRRGVSIRSIIAHRKQQGNLDLDVDAYVGMFRQELIDTGKSRSSTRLRDGRVIAVESTAMDGGGWVAIHEDATEQLQNELSMFNQATALARTNMRFEAALSNMTQGVCLFDAEKNLVIANGRFREMYEYPEELVVPGTPLLTMLEYQLRQGVTSDLSLGQHLELLPQLSEQEFETAKGRVMSIKRSPTQDGGWVATHEDITERKRAEVEIAHMARHDGLTGLYNRAEFNARLIDVGNRAKRNGGTATVLMLDLDKFKAVNDTLGHPAGDQLLIEVGRRLQAMLRETDVLARLGGDEFAIIQDVGPHQREGAIALAQRIIAAIAAPFDLDGHSANVGTSIGIAMAPDHGVDPEQLMTAADLALYEAKSSGRNDFRLFKPEMLDVARTQKLAESELRDAITLNQFELHYQPVIDVKNYLLCGVEALLRWRHPERGLVMPDHFIPLAEATGLIAPLGEWVLRQACIDAAFLPGHVKVAVNVSAVQFRKGNLYEVILRVLDETGIAPERLELEITETSHLENQESYLAMMRQLKKIGISLVLDDFGTGYSSINYLTTFPIDKIKIDKSFTQGALDRIDCAAVIASTLALSQGLGLITTAEGVESEQQFEYMRKAGVDLVQGYLFGKPVPLAEFGPQAARTLETLCRIHRPSTKASVRKRDAAKLRA